MSDEELNKEWVPSGRPQSTMARSFSLALDDVFKIDNSLADLDAVVDQKKKAVSSQEAELQALEARLKAAEERLKASSNNKAGSSRGPASPRQRIPLGDTFGGASNHAAVPEEAQPSASSASAGARTPSRPGTAKRPVSSRNPPSMPSYAAPPLPGALPPTPGASEDGDSQPQHQQ